MASKSEVPDLLKTLWHDFGFTPNAEQEAAVLHADGPLFLPAGPGSGKTRVLLWRTVNLITTHGIKPDEIYLSTFTEKAALQLRNGLRTLLSAVSEKTGKPYDTAKLYVGTVHSLCQRLLLDRRISANRSRSQAPVLLDELDQFMFLRRQRNWDALLLATGFTKPEEIIPILEGRGASRHEAISRLLGFFNRLSEEMIDPDAALKKTKDPTLQALLKGYAAYRHQLATAGLVAHTDLSLLQTVAVEHLLQNAGSGHVFRHVIVDEYQDTNPVQEKIFFQLASGHKNFCVVGDDDQALYRFRGATVENFVDFPERCQKHLGLDPRRIVLATNYRSREDIVGFYNRFIVHWTCNWSKGANGAYRVMDKTIVAHRKEKATAVVASSAAAPEDVAKEIAGLVRKLLDAGKVEDPNQIAFLFPSLKSPHVQRMTDALDAVGLKVYAPRAGQFLDVPESRAVFGLLFQVFGKFEHLHTDFNNWMTSVYQKGAVWVARDRNLGKFIEQKRTEVQAAATDYDRLAKLLEKHGWSADDSYEPDTMPQIFAAAPGLSERVKRSLKSATFARYARERIRLGKPPTIQFAVTRATSLDWNVLDFFYQLAGFKEFKALFDLGESGKDEGPVCNLSLISQYLSRFLDHYPFIISGESIQTGQFVRNLGNYLYVLFRRGESEYEDAEDPFPKGRIPFITVHQSKGLEFPVVILANPRKDPKAQAVEKLVAPILSRKGKPLDRMPAFDVMRMFYVALSRAKNLLVLAHFKGPGQRLHAAFDDMISSGIPRIPRFDVSTVPEAKAEEQELPQSYSYTGDFLLYQRCPRQYMLFRRYGFAPARSLTMFFGSLVHQTIEDLHQSLIDSRRNAK